MLVLFGFSHVLRLTYHNVLYYTSSKEKAKGGYMSLSELFGIESSALFGISAKRERLLRKPVAMHERNAMHFRNTQIPANRADGVLLQNRTFAQRTQPPGAKPTKSSTKRRYRGGSMRQAFIPDPPTLGIKIVPPAALVPDVPSGCRSSKHILPNGLGGRHGVFPTGRGYPAEQGTATPNTPC